jgi:cysteine desulfurase / selenocysteine lyase
MTHAELRSYFPNTSRGIYLNHAGSGPLSTNVVQAIQAYLEQRHLTDVENWELVEPLIESARAACATLVGASPENIEFVESTSAGLSILAEGLDWQPGDRIAIPSCEFPANVYPFMNLADRGVEIDWIPHRDGRVILEDVEAALTPHTRLLSASWVQFLSGDRIDVEQVGRMCRDNGTIFCLDAIQGLGALRLDVSSAGIDFLSTGSQKWLMATRGSGFIYVSDSIIDSIRPRAGWLHGPVDWDDFLNYRLEFFPDARRFRLGTLNMIGAVALGAALNLHDAFGAEEAECIVLKRVSRLASAFDEKGYESFGRKNGDVPRSGIVTIRHPKARRIFESLTKEGVTISLRNGMLRFSPTYYNTNEEIDHVISMIASIDESH